MKKSLDKLVDEYLQMRRALGFKAEREKWLLTSFVTFLQAKQSGYITTAHALAWAKQPTDADPMWWASKLSVVRCFAKHLHLVDCRHEIPPPNLVPHCVRRTTPAIYTEDEVERLLRAAREMPSLWSRSSTSKQLALRRATAETLFGLLAATGMRVGEAIRLDCSDVDWENHLLAIRDSKFRKSREVPIHSSVIRALQRYAKARDCVHPKQRSLAFFVSTVGTRLIYVNVHTTFRKLLRLADIQRDRARVHDLRHTFVVQTILGWHRNGNNVETQMPTLSTYVGHKDPSSTYWYLTATPELMALVGRKLQRALGALP